MPTSNYIVYQQVLILNINIYSLNLLMYSAFHRTLVFGLSGLGVWNESAASIS